MLLVRRVGQPGSDVCIVMQQVGSGERRYHRRRFLPLRTAGSESRKYYTDHLDRSILLFFTPYFSPVNGVTAQSPSGSAAPRKPRLLLAEDEPSLADFLCEVLHDDYEVEVATEGGQAWASILRRPPDLLLSDVRMHGMNGIELTRRLRADPRTARVPVLLLTASNEEQTQLDGLAAGADALVLKPFRLREVIEGLHALLQAPASA